MSDNLSTYFQDRHARAADNIHTAYIVETAVAHDMRKIASYGQITQQEGGAILSAMNASLRTDEGARTWYKHTRKSRMLERLEAVFRFKKPDDLLREAEVSPTKIGGIDLQTGEFTVPLANGYSITSGWIDHDDPDALPAGDYLAVEDAKGKQLFYIETADLLVNPLEAKGRLYDFLSHCLGATSEVGTSADGPASAADSSSI